jgi:prevent-host-death family protein
MDITVTQFKARCLGIIAQVQREKVQVVILRHGQPAAVLSPMQERAQGKLFGRAAKTTQVVGSLLSTGEAWDAER